MNPFQIPLAMDELTSIEELNPDIVLGLQDVKKVIDSIDDQVVKGLSEGIVPSFECADVIDNEVYYQCCQRVEKGEQLLSDCDDYCMQVYGHPCIVPIPVPPVPPIPPTPGVGCPTCDTPINPSNGFIQGLQNTAFIEFERAFPSDRLFGFVRDRNNRRCRFTIIAFYCQKIVEGEPHFISCDKFAVYPQDNHLLISNCVGDGTGLLCEMDFGNTGGVMDWIYEAGIRHLQDGINNNTIVCPGGIIPQPIPQPIPTPIPIPSPIPSPIPVPVPTPVPVPSPQGCCPPTQITVQPCQLPEIKVEPIINVTVQPSTQEPIPTTPAEQCPDRNDIDMLVSICGEGHLLEFIEREGLKQITTDMSIGKYLEQRWNFDKQVSEPQFVRS